MESGSQLAWACASLGCVLAGEGDADRRSAGHFVLVGVCRGGGRDADRAQRKPFSLA